MKRDGVCVETYRGVCGVVVKPGTTGEALGLEKLYESPNGQLALRTGLYSGCCSSQKLLVESQRKLG
jgi:hypothetical protein